MRMSTSAADVRLVQMAAYGGPYRGSFVPMLTSIVDAARDRGWHASALFGPIERPAWLDDFEERGVPVDFVSPRPLGAASRRLRERLRGRGRVIVHTHFTYFDIPASWALRRLPNSSLVWHLHEAVPATRSRRLRRAAKFALGRRNLDAALCVNAATAESLRTLPVVRSERVVHLPNSVDLGRFPLVTAETRRRARVALGLPEDIPVVLHFGRDWELKGGDLFVQAMAQLTTAGTRALGLTVWAGERARDDAARFGVEDVVRVQPPTDAVQDLYAAADLVVSCSRQEADPFAVLEGLASGLGVVVASPNPLRVPPVPSVLAAGFEPAAIAGGLRSLLERTPERVAADAREARAWAQQNVGLEAYAARTMAIYDALLADRPPTDA